MSGWVPLAEDDWFPLREMLRRERGRPEHFRQRVVGRWEGGAAYRREVRTPTALLHILWNADTWELCGRRGLNTPHEMIDWPLQERLRAVVGRAWTSISHPAGGEYHDIYARRRSTELAPPGPPPASSRHDTPIRTGAAGRPSSMDLIRAELRRRMEAELAQPGATEEAAELLNWLVANHPDAPRPIKRTIANNIGAEGSARRARYSARNPALN